MVPSLKARAGEKLTGLSHKPHRSFGGVEGKIICRSKGGMKRKGETGESGAAANPRKTWLPRVIHRLVERRGDGGIGGGEDNT